MRGSGIHQYHNVSMNQIPPILIQRLPFLKQREVFLHPSFPEYIHNVLNLPPSSLCIYIIFVKKKMPGAITVVFFHQKNVIRCERLKVI